jgi:2-polyprenyl-3-methyl-5-hydroxy-6-metoxy-1,4-benzoquinol methylase
MNAAGKSVDKTFLSINTAEDRGYIHRDYIAHCMRWSHVVKRLYERGSYQTARILDVGCGKELPLAKLLYSSKLIPQMYYGVDVGPINDEDAAKIAREKFPHKLWEQCNFLDINTDDLCEFSDPRPNIVVCFEVLEHVEPKMMFEMLEHMKALTSDDCRYFISTPCWNRTDCAANHVNEMLYESLGAGFERHGFVIENVYGTFASIRDYEMMLAKDERLHSIFRGLREYYDTNFLSCIFAPLFPAQSRNCLWELRKKTMQHGDNMDRFPKIETIQQPWSSSTLWQDMSL